MSTRPRQRSTLVALILVAVMAVAAGCATPLTPDDAPTLTPASSPPASQDATPAPSPRPTRDVPVASSSLRDRSPGTTTPMPAAVRVPRLGATVDVEPVGVAADGQMEIPAYAEVAGWYRFGVAPGADTGTAVIAAHVDSIASEGLGPFARLREAKQGDEVEVTLDDGSTVAYVIDGIDRQPKQGIDWEEVFVRDGEARLVLITCGGRFLRDLGRYEDNVLVTAVPAPA